MIEKSLAIEQQFIHGVSVDGNLSIVVHCDTWQLLNQVIQHASFLQVKSIRIIDQGILVHIELYFRCLYHNIFQLLHFVQGALFGIFTLHIQRLPQDSSPFLFVKLRNLDFPISIFIIRMSGMKNIAASFLDYKHDSTLPTVDAGIAGATG